MPENLTITPFTHQAVRDRALQLVPSTLNEMQLIVKRSMEPAQTSSWVNATLFLLAEEVAQTSRNQQNAIELTFIEELSQRFQTNSFASGVEASDMIVAHEMEHYLALRTIRPVVQTQDTAIEISLLQMRIRGTLVHDLVAFLNVSEDILASLTAMEDIALRLAPTVVSPGDIMVVARTISQLSDWDLLTRSVLEEIRGLSQGKLASSYGESPRELNFSELVGRA